MRVYDILDAGDNHRFMVNGRIVSNCATGINLQNLKKISLKDILLARDIVNSGEYERIEVLYDSTTDVLSQLVRTTITSKKEVLTVVDFSAIEARVCAWLSNEQWVLDVFTGDGKIYEAAASRMYHIPIHHVNKEQRQKGKVASLACQYGGGVGALLAMGAIKMGLREEELQPIVDSWRSANPNIVKFWYAVERAAKKAIRINTVVECGKIKFVKGVGVLYMILPNGGRLAYFRPSLDEQGNICHWAINQYTRKYEMQRTYSGKLVENMCQRISRDLLVSAMLETDVRGFDIVAHVHDEIILDGDCFDEVRKIMSTVPKWAEGLPLGADGGVSRYYVK